MEYQTTERPGEVLSPQADHKRRHAELHRALLEIRDKFCAATKRRRPEEIPVFEVTAWLQSQYWEDLGKAFRELLIDYLSHNRGASSKDTSLAALIQWSGEQVQEPAIFSD